MSDVLQIHVERHLAWVSIQKPERMNALTPSEILALASTLEALDAREDVRVLILSGSGGHSFCAGVDLKALSPEEIERFPLPMRGDARNPFERISELSKPLIACIEGVAMGGGAELALASDLRLVSSDVRFAFPEAKVGMGANFASVVLPTLLPKAVALELLYTGQPLSAERGVQHGLFNAAYPAAELRANVLDLANAIAANAPLSVRRLKAMTSKSHGLPISVGLRLDVGPNPYTSLDRVEGLRAFKEKRAPQFLGH